MWTVTGEELRQIGAAYVAASATPCPRKPHHGQDASQLPFRGPHPPYSTKRAELFTFARSGGHLSFVLSPSCSQANSLSPYDLGEAGKYYSADRRLMAHWRRALLAQDMLEVQYERLVSDFAAEARRIVAHCDLPWDDACLEFHKTSRTVNTASMTQVRQPIYRSSVARWRPEATLLRPLLDALEMDSGLTV